MGLCVQALMEMLMGRLQAPLLPYVAAWVPWTTKVNGSHALLTMMRNSERRRRMATRMMMRRNSEKTVRTNQKR